jgi:hypothetical protein
MCSIYCLGNLECIFASRTSSHTCYDVHHCKIHEVKLIDVCALCSFTSPEQVDPGIFQRCGAMHLGFLDRISVILLRISPSYDGSNPCTLNFSQLRCTPPGVLCAMDRAPSSQADDSCWTCRRRWKCDRTLPSCRKCAATELHCLGYAKERPLRWTNSVASRGKLMGIGASWMY